MSHQRIHQNVEFDQPVQTQEIRFRRRPPFGPGNRQRHSNATTRITDQNLAATPTLGIQHLHPLTNQRMKRMGHQHQTRKLSGRTRTMRGPSELLAL